MGHITYLVESKPTLATGTEIRNIANITFDFGETIATNQVDPHDPSQDTDPAKECLNTIDAAPPTSQATYSPSRVWPLIMGFSIAPSAAGGEDWTA